MHDLIEKNKADLTEDEIRVISLALNRGNTAYLTPAKEGHMFALYSQGRTTADIAKIASIPHETVIFSKIQYNWNYKRSLVALDSPSETIREQATVAADTLMAAMMLRINLAFQQASDGKEDTTGLMPKSIQDMEKMLKMLDGIHKLGITSSPKSDGATVNITTQIAAGNGSQVSVVEQPALLDSPEGRMAEMKKIADAK